MTRVNPYGIPQGISGVRQWRSDGVAIGIPMAYPWRTFCTFVTPLS